MKRLARILLVLIATANLTTAAEHIDSVFKIGVNWQRFNNSSDGGRLLRTCN